MILSKNEVSKWQVCLNNSKDRKFTAGICGR